MQARVKTRRSALNDADSFFHWGIGLFIILSVFCGPGYKRERQSMRILTSAEMREVDRLTTER
jgi:hypothetical protein